MANNSILPAVGEVVEDIQVADGSKRQVVTVRSGDGSLTDPIGSVTETAPITDIVASGLNGRLQRIAQRISTLIGSTLATSVADGQNISFGARTDDKNANTDTSSISFMAIAKYLSYTLQAILAGPLNVLPSMVSGGNTSADTAATGTNWTSFPSISCKQLTIVNGTVTPILFRQDSAGATIPIAVSSAFPIYGLTNANQISVQRSDQGNTPITVAARWER